MYDCTTTNPELLNSWNGDPILQGIVVELSSLTSWVVENLSELQDNVSDLGSNNDEDEMKIRMLWVLI